jgi:hypothetical protein
VIGTLLIVFILHNLLVRDYKGEILHQLKEELSEEEIENFVPIRKELPLQSERMVELQNEMQRLSAEMKQLRQILNETLVSMGKNPLEKYPS